jgi:hypothetical protein
MGAILRGGFTVRAPWTSARARRRCLHGFRRAPWATYIAGAARIARNSRFRREPAKKKRVSLHANLDMFACFLATQLVPLCSTAHT